MARCFLRTNLHVLAADEHGLSLAPARDPIRLTGRVTTPMRTSGPRVVVATDRGAMRVLEVNPTSAREPVIDAVAPVGASFQTPLDSYLSVEGGSVVAANDRLTRYEIQTSRSQLASQWLGYRLSVLRNGSAMPCTMSGGAAIHRPTR